MATPVTTLVHFSVPAANAERFLAFWRDVLKDDMTRQPGLVGGALHRAVDAAGPFQFVNIARWDSREALAAGLREADRSLRARGIDTAGVFADLGVTVSQSLYVEEVGYAPTPDLPPTG